VTLLIMSLPFIFSMLGLGLYISTRVSTRESASQMAMGTMMPSIFLSAMSSQSIRCRCSSAGWPGVSDDLADRCGPRVILRGAGWNELWLHALVLTSMGAALFALAMLKFEKRLA